LCGVLSSVVWGGVREGMVKVEGFGATAPMAVQTEVLARQRDIAAGSSHPFHAKQAALSAGRNVKPLTQWSLLRAKHELAKA